MPHFEAVATQGKGVFETFRGISHLLMEKVTKELHRGSGPATSARPVPAAEPAAPPRPLGTAGPAPSPPARAIAREAQEKRASEPAPATIDYGREIQLPTEIPPPPPPETVGNGAAAHAHRAPKDTPAPVRTSPEPSRQAAASPASAQDLVVRPEAVATTPTSVVVPVKLPANGTPGEVLIRIVIERQD